MKKTIKKPLALLLLLLVSFSADAQTYDSLEYATGRLSAQKQLFGYPLPRFKPNHTLNRNFIWFGLEYFSEWQQPGVSNQQMISNAKVNNVEFYRNWNYYFMVSSNIGSYSSPANYQDTINSFNGAMVSIARKNPSWKTSAISFWPQIGGNASNGNLSPDHYLRNSSGQFLDNNGNVSSTKYWSPVAPGSSIVSDGQKQKTYLDNLVNALDRPVDIINENGEILPLMSLNGNVIKNDPYVQSDYLGLGYPSTVNATSTNDYRGRRFSDQTKLYRDQFMSSYPSTIFTHYGIDGQIDYRPLWTHAKSINSKIKGRNYSTGDFYPRWPSNWRGWAGPWHGLGWMADCKYWEEAEGDSLFSPFIAAGWNINEVNNVRPAQYLALLKILSNWGAEFFYTGYFSLAPPFPSPTNWGWQTVIPVYAQAVSSRYEEFFRNGMSLQGDVPGNFLVTTLSSNKPKYLFRTGDNRKLVAVRKLYNQQKYIITTAQMVDANTVGNAMDVSWDKFKLGQDSLLAEFRRQGSVYFYDADSGVFYQLDKWHQREHPERWDKNIDIEAEVFDNSYNAKIKTYGLTRNGSTLNTTNYVSCINMNRASMVEYNFSPRTTAVSSQYVFFRIRNTESGTTKKMNIRISNNSTITIKCIEDTAWTWYRVRMPVYPNTNNKIMVFPGGEVELDKFVVTEDSGYVAGGNYSQCYSVTSKYRPFNSEEALLRTFPTDASDNITVRIENSEESLVGQLLIFDSMGRVCYKKDSFVFNDSSLENTINVVGLRPGVYTVSFVHSKGVSSSRFVKK